MEGARRYVVFIDLSKRSLEARKGRIAEEMRFNLRKSEPVQVGIGLLLEYLAVYAILSNI